MKSIVVGTAGHIDHGKSTLVKALTGTDPDRLKEEKERGITIDLGFANLQLTSEVNVAFVDVPGHERFIKNMLAGVGGIDAVLLVVAADESIMPQTREHFDICQLLNIKTGAVAITKTDLVEPDMLELVRAEVKEFLSGSFLRNSPVIPTSAATGSGLSQLKAALVEIALNAPPRNSEAVFRLPIDRSFTLRGFGTIVTGTLISGKIQKDDEVEIYPACKKSRIRNIQVHGQPVESASAGQRTALNLQNVDVGEVQRGMELSLPDRFHSVRLVDGVVKLLASSPVPLKSQTPVRFHHGTSELMARLRPIEAKQISPGQSGYVRVSLESPILVIPGDRFILRRTSPMITIGGGHVLDVRPLPGRKHLGATIEFLNTLEKQNLKEILSQLVKKSGISGMDRAEILAQTTENELRVREALFSLSKEGRLEVLSGNPLQVISGEAFETLCKKSLEVVGEFHQRDSLSTGMPKEELYSALFRDSPPNALKAVLAELSRTGRMVIEQDRLRLAGREISLNPNEATAKKSIERIFLKAGLKVPHLDEALSGLPIPKEQARRIVVLLTNEKKLVKISENLFFHGESIARLKKVLADQKNVSERIDVAKFKILTDVSRKYAIPLLEYLDRERITRRSGDFRVIL